MKRLMLLTLVFLLAFAYGEELFAMGLPDPLLTPGVTLGGATVDSVCHTRTGTIRNVPDSVKQAVYLEYHRAPRTSPACTGPHHACYEVDHLCPLELGCSNSPQNLWIQEYDSKPWNAHMKDKLENRLHKLVCNGTLSLQAAQQCIIKDWTSCYTETFKGE